MQTPNNIKTAIAFKKTMNCLRMIVHSSVEEFRGCLQIRFFTWKARCQLLEKQGKSVYLQTPSKLFSRLDAPASGAKLRRSDSRHRQPLPRHTEEFYGVREAVRANRRLRG